MAYTKRAYDLSRKEVFFCDAKKSISHVAEILHTNNIGSVIITDKDVIKGIITVNDLLRQGAKNANFETVLAKEVMSSPVVTASRRLDVEEVVDVFNEHGVSRLVLVDSNDKPVGVLRDIAVYKYLATCKFEREAKKRFSPDYARPLY